MDESPKSNGNFFKTLDVTYLIKVSKRKHMKFNMLLVYCIGKAAVGVKEFYILPVGEKLIQYDTIAVNTIVKNKDGEVSTLSFQFYHTQMDGAHAGRFLANLQKEINGLK